MKNYLLFLPRLLRASILSLLLLISLVMAFSPFPLFIILKLFPNKKWRYMCTACLLVVARIWTVTNQKILEICLPTQWEWHGFERIIPEKTALFISNHVTLLDIPMVFSAVLRGGAPFARFFLKSDLLFVPIIGAACWAMEFPFMRRYSQEKLAKHPELRGVDTATTRAACAKYQGHPATIVNYVEGTRRSPKKIMKQQPPYQYLLKPKSAGIATAIQAMGEQFAYMADVSICVPEQKIDFWLLASGQIKKIVIDVKVLDIPQDLLHQDYDNDPIFREKFQNWVRELWHNKDARMAEIIQKL